MEIIKRDSEEADLRATADIVSISEDEMLYLNRLDKNEDSEQIAKSLNVSKQELKKFNRNLVRNLPGKSKELAYKLSKAALEDILGQIEGKTSAKEGTTESSDQDTHRLSYLLKKVSE